MVLFDFTSFFKLYLLLFFLDFIFLFVKSTLSFLCTESCFTNKLALLLCMKLE